MKPAKCGNCFPGSRNRADGAQTVALAQAEPGPVRVARISEKIELDDEALAFLADASLTPGSTAAVVAVEPGGVVVDSDTGRRTVPTDVARLTFVTRA